MNARDSKTAMRLATPTVSSAPSGSQGHAAQNADDNAYPPGVIPTLEMLVLPTDIILLNNEVSVCVYVCV
jgi:hypothetical protein